MLNPDDVGQTLSVCDLNGITPGHFTGPVREAVREISELTKNHYPERSFRIAVVNAPYVFGWVIWPVVKAFLDPVTLTKIHIESGNGKDFLLQHIAAEDLPKEYGGLCECKGGCDKNSEMEKSLAHFALTVNSRVR